MDNFAIKKIDLKFNFIFWSIGFCAFIKLKIVHAAKTEFVQFNVPCDFYFYFSYFLQTFSSREFLCSGNYLILICRSLPLILSENFLSQLSLQTFSVYLHFHNTTHVSAHTTSTRKKKDILYGNFPTRKKNENEEKKMKNQKNIFQLTASVDVCVYGNRDAFLCFLKTGRKIRENSEFKGKSEIEFEKFC